MKELLFISINDHIPWGGSEVLWSETAGLLTKAKDVNLNILVKKWSPVPSQIKLLEQSGARIYFKQEIKIADKNSIVSRAIKKVPLKKRNYHELDAIGNNKRLDLVVISLGNHLDLKLLYYCDYLIKNEITYALVIQLGTDLRSLSGYYVKSYRRVYRGAKKVYFVSERNKREMQVTLASDLSNSEIINNPFNYNQELVPIKSEIKNYQLACVASLNVLHKGQELLLKVLSAEKWKRRELKVNLYGKGDSQYHLEELIKYFDLEKKL